jgi:DNA-binding PadR family transcriptional regulator
VRHHHRMGGHGHPFFGRGPFGFHGHHGRGRDGFEGGFGERGGGRGGGRFFDQGGLRLVVLKLIADKPRHGYELIKALEEASGGAYSPSPGVIYPTLTLLEEMGFTTASDAGGGRKLFTITAEGQVHLETSSAMVKGIFEKMAAIAERAGAFHPQIMRARENLRAALRLKMSRGALTTEQAEAVATALDAAAKAVERA